MRSSLKSRFLKRASSSYSSRRLTRCCSSRYIPDSFPAAASRRLLCDHVHHQRVVRRDELEQLLLADADLSPCDLEIVAFSEERSSIASVSRS